MDNREIIQTSKPMSEQSEAGCVSVITTASGNCIMEYTRQAEVVK